MKRYYNVTVLENTYNVGDLVYILDPTYKQGTSKKLAAPWKGSYVIIDKITPYLYKVKKTIIKKQSKITIALKSAKTV